LKVKKIAGARCVKFRSLRYSGAKHLITTNDAGCVKKGRIEGSARLSNLLLEAFGNDVTHFIIPEHGDRVLHVPAYIDGRSQMFRCDGLIHTIDLRPSKPRTWKPAVASCATADCQFVMFSADYLSPDLDSLRSIGLIHSGWRSCVKNIVGKAMAMLKQFGCPMSQLQVGLWGGICPKCYVVDEPVWKQLLPYHRYFTPAADPKHWHLDLRGIVRQQLLDAGVKPRQISTSMFCSHCQRERNGNHVFASHRRGDAERNGIFIAAE
jgi:copper oxidase (laccase) domain-containing protein